MFQAILVVYIEVIIGYLLPAMGRVWSNKACPSTVNVKMIMNNQTQIYLGTHTVVNFN